MHPSLAKRFRSGRACLDFLHTGGTGDAGSGDWVEPELVHDQASLERWLAHVLALPVAKAQARDVAAAHQLRAALWRLALARAGDGHFAAGDVQTLNAFAARMPPVPQLLPAGRSAPSVTTVSAGLSALARDAIDLFTGPLGRRIRVCASEDCALLFVDASRPGTRRWCSMERCGNLAKVRGHRARRAD